MNLNVFIGQVELHCFLSSPFFIAPLKTAASPDAIRNTFENAFVTWLLGGGFVCFED